MTRPAVPARAVPTRPSLSLRVWPGPAGRTVLALTRYQPGQPVASHALSLPVHQLTDDAACPGLLVAVDALLAELGAHPDDL